MKSTSIDTVLELRARVAAAIAEHQGLLCGIVTGAASMASP